MKTSSAARTARPATEHPTAIPITAPFFRPFDEVALRLEVGDGVDAAVELELDDEAEAEVDEAELDAVVPLVDAEVVELVVDVVLLELRLELEAAVDDCVDEDLDGAAELLEGEAAAPGKTINPTDGMFGGP